MVPRVLLFSDALELRVVDKQIPSRIFGINDDLTSGSV